MEMRRDEVGGGSAITPRVIVGLFMLTAGVLWILDRMGQIHFWDYGRYWPVFLVALGLLKVFQRGTRGFGVVLLFFGSWALLATLDVVRFEWDYMWPAALILIGGSLIVRGWRSGLAGRACCCDPDAGGSGPGGAASRLSGSGAAGSGGSSGGGSGVAPGDPSARVNLFALVGAARHRSASRSFRGGEATALMGGCEIDLSQAVPAPEGAVLDTFAVWGGIDIKVPEDWTVTLRGTPVLGGFTDHRRGAQPDPAKHLIVKGLAVMGGVEVKD